MPSQTAKNGKSTQSSAAGSGYGFWILVLVFIVLGIGLRCYSIGDRPMHSDEGVNYHFVKGMMKDGYYHYSHKNYHGPTYFYFLYAVHSIFGTNDFTHRLPAILSGIGIFLSPLLLLKLFSIKALAAPVLLLSLSSGLIFYSRYSIHETLLVLSSMLFMFFAFLWIERKNAYHLIGMGVSVALLLATKETCIIFGFAVVVAALCTYPPVQLFRALVKDWFLALWGIFFFVLVTISFFSGFFMHSEGLREMIMGIEQWIGRGHSDTGHHKPFPYYFNMLVKAEPLALLVVLPLLYYTLRGVFSFIKKLFSGKFALKTLRSAVSAWYDMFSTPLDRVIFCSALTTAIIFVVYSYVPYKTPWLIINITAPALFSFGLFLYKISTKKLFHYAVLLVLFVPSLWYSLKFNFEKKSLPDVVNSTIETVGTFVNENPYSYVQTTDGMVHVVEDIIKFFQENPDMRVLIGARTHWPMPYYLRDHYTKVSYGRYRENDVDGDTYGIMVLNREEEWESPHWIRKYTRLSGVQESQVYYSKKYFAEAPSW